MRNKSVVLLAGVASHDVKKLKLSGMFKSLVDSKGAIRNFINTDLIL